MLQRHPALPAQRLPDRQPQTYQLMAWLRCPPPEHPAVDGKLGSWLAAGVAIAIWDLLVGRWFEPLRLLEREGIMA